MATPPGDVATAEVPQLCVCYLEDLLVEEGGSQSGLNVLTFSTINEVSVKGVIVIVPVDAPPDGTFVPSEGGHEHLGFDGLPRSL